MKELAVFFKGFWLAAAIYLVLLLTSRLFAKIFDWHESFYIEDGAFTNTYLLFPFFSIIVLVMLAFFIAVIYGLGTVFTAKGSEEK